MTDPRTPPYGWDAHPPASEHPAGWPAPPTVADRRSGRMRKAGAAALAVALVATGAITGRLVDGSRTVTVAESSTTAATATAATSGLTVADISSRVQSALVDVYATGTSSSSPVFGDGENPFGSGETETESAGTGMILSSTGLVLTNAHVIADATSISVVEDGQTVKHAAKLVGEDAAKDVALIQIEGVSGLPTVTLGNSSGTVAGDSVLAIGNALDLKTGGFSVSSGIISGLARSISTDNGEQLTGLLQTDAAISSGDSGGPLVDAAGDVIGMDTASASSTSENTAQDIGFAIPVNEIKALIPTLEKGDIGTPTYGSSASSTPTTGSSGSGYGFGYGSLGGGY